MIFYEYTTFSSIQSSTDGHLGCFNFLAIMYNAAMNVQVQVFVCTFFSFLLNIYLREWLDHMINLCLTIWRTAILFSKLRHFTFSLAVHAKFYFLHIIADTCYYLSDYSHPTRCGNDILLIFKFMLEF